MALKEDPFIRTSLIVWCQAEAIFSETEASQLCELFNLSNDDLELLLAGSSYIFAEGGYVAMPSVKLASELVEAGIRHEQAEVFASVWREGADEYIEQCKKLSILAPQRLSGIDWQLLVETADSAGTRSQRGFALLQLQLTADAPVRMPSC